MTDNFQTRNPSHLGVAISTTPIPFQAKHGAERGSGPVSDMCYILFERNLRHIVENYPNDGDAVPNPTKDNHAGWDMIGEGIFKGWEGTGDQNEEFQPIFHALDSKKRVLNSDEEREKIKFIRISEPTFASGRDLFLGYRATNQIKNYLRWVECEYYTHPITRKQGYAKLNMLSTGEDRTGEKLPEEIQSKILSTNLPKNVTPPRPSTPDLLYLGGNRNKRRRKSRRKGKSRGKRKSRRKGKLRGKGKSRRKGKPRRKKRRRKTRKRLIF